MVKGDWGRCLEMILSDMPGHEVKWLLFMEEVKVDLTGLRASA